MAKMICELCGGKIVAKEGGVFACSDCGLEYSISRLRELQNTAPTTVVPVDEKKNSGADQYIKLANNLLYSSNKNPEKALEYCELALEHEPENISVWIMKIKAQSLLNKNIVEDCIHMLKSFSLSAEDKKSVTALLREYLNGVNEDYLAPDLLVVLGLENGKTLMAPILQKAIRNLEKNISEAAKLVRSYDSKYGYGKYSNYWSGHNVVRDVCVNFSRGLSFIKDAPASFYEDSKRISELCSEGVKLCGEMGKLSYKNDYGTTLYYLSENKSAAKEVDNFCKQFAKIKSNCEDVQRRKEKAQYEKYWAEHRERWDELHRELKNIENERRAVDESPEIKEIALQVSQLKETILKEEEMRKQMGLFSFSRKKESLEKINSLESKKARLEGQMSSIKGRMINALNSRKQAIENELSKTR